MTRRGSNRRSIAGFGVFAASIFASAFLIFAVQPMVAKHILPWFGGTPGVWLICLAFYQSALFLGYAYAYWLIARVSTLHQPLIHGLVFVAASFVLPVLPGENWKPVEAGGASELIFAMLVANVAIPFIWLASTGPLVQAWFARAFPERSPYPLYAVSNFGSLLALLSYPVFVEPGLAIPAQSVVWSFGFAVAGVAVLCCAWWAALGASERAAVSEATQSEAPAEVANLALGSTHRGFWILFPGCAVILFMGVTNQLCLDVASVPLLWILPLSIYLVSLILCFASERLYPRALCMGLGVALLTFHIAIVEWKLIPAASSFLLNSLPSQIGLYCTMLFLGCMVSHGELYRLRPAPSALTQFYLCVAGGGALGGLFVGLVAPRIFDGYYELPIGVAACWGLAMAATWMNPSGIFAAKRRRVVWALVIGISFAIFGTYLLGTRQPTAGTTLAVERGFFGILRVAEGKPGAIDAWISLANGTTNHGLQYTQPESRGTATTYYGAITGVGLVLADKQAGDEPMKVGVVGLGIGTLAAYGRAGDQFIFYEIDPNVAKIAANENYFTYLHDSSAETEIVMGDARLSLESELETEGSRAFDVLVIDAFSSDAIPMHLLTREAFEVYSQHLANNGVLAIHITNRHLDLAPLVFHMGSSLGLQSLRVRNIRVPKLRSLGAEWVILSRSAPYLQRLGSAARARGNVAKGHAMIRVGRPVAAKIAGFPYWTDEYSNILSVLKSAR